MIDQAATHMIRATRGAATDVVRDLAAVAPVVARSIGTATARSVHDLDALARRQLAGAREQGARTVEGLVDDLVQQPLVVHAIERVIDQIKWRVVDDVLPIILERLAKEPAQVRQIVRGQSRGMVEELSQAARDRAIEGDEKVDRLVARFLHRRHSDADGRVRRGASASASLEGVLPAQP